MKAAGPFEPSWRAGSVKCAHCGPGADASRASKSNGKRADGSMTEARPRALKTEEVSLADIGMGVYERG